MARHPTPAASTFPTIDGTALEGVTGGRMIPRKGIDPTITAGFKGLAEAVASAGQVMTQKKAEGAQQTQQLMQQMMQKRQGG